MYVYSCAGGVKKIFAGKFKKKQFIYVYRYTPTIIYNNNNIASVFFPLFRVK